MPKYDGRDEENRASWLDDGVFHRDWRAGAFGLSPPREKSAASDGATDGNLGGPFVG